MNFPKSFCITLSETPDRLEYSKKQFVSVNIQPTYYNGFFGKKLELSCNLENSEERGSSVKLNDGQIGCFLSHVSLWRMLETLDVDEFIIFEDDVCFCENFRQRFLDTYNELPKNWEYVFLGHEGLNNCKKLIKISSNVYQAFPYCTYAYMIKKRILHSMIEASYPIYLPIDMQLQKHLADKINSYVLVPPLITHQSSLHTITCLFKSQTYNWDENYLKIKN